MPDQQINRQRLFLGCVMSLVATAFGFAVRGAILENWRTEFNLTQEQIGYLLGAGLFPFAISIILFSLIIDRIGNGVSMAIAFTLHVVSAVDHAGGAVRAGRSGSSPEAIAAGQRTGFTLLYIGTFIFALGNGTVEAVVNPVTATLFPREKTRYLNILHAGWPGGLVLGGLLAIAVQLRSIRRRVPGRLWQWQIGARAAADDRLRPDAVSASASRCRSASRRTCRTSTCCASSAPAAVSSSASFSWPASIRSW